MLEFYQITAVVVFNFFKKIKKLELTSLERKFQSVFEQDNASMLFLDLGGSVIVANQKFARLVDLTREEVSGKSIFKLISFADNHKITDHFSQLSKGIITHINSKGKVFRKDGVDLWKMINLSIIRDEKGRPEFIAVVMNDITEVIQLKEELAQKNKLLEAIIENTPVAIFMKDRENDFRFKLWNKGAEELWGLKREMMLGKNDYDFFPKKEGDFFREKDLQVLNSNNPLFIQEESITLPNGEIHFLSTKKVPIEGRYLLGVSEDITEKRNREKRLNTLYCMIQESQDIFLYLDLDGRPLFVNESAEVNLGWKSDSDSFFHFLPGSSYQKYQEIVIPFINQTGEQWEGELLLKNLKTGEEIPYLIRIFGLKGEGGEFNYFAMSGRDLRERKHWEATMLSASKMSALGEMAAGIAHELNNPLSIIMGKSGVLMSYIKRDKLSPEMAIEELEKIILTAERMAKIIKGLRLFARNGEHDSYERIEVKKLIMDVIDLCANKFADSNVSLDFGQIPEVFIDGQTVQLGQVLLNLLSNALDAVQSCQEKWVYLEVFQMKEKGSIQITITDSGSGIPVEIAERIMEPFFTTKEVGKGTGLGLSISRGIIESHDGRLYIDRTCKNTRFVIEIPIHQMAS